MDQSTSFSREMIIVAAKDQVSSDLGGEAVILDLKAAVYFGLNDVGSRVWSLIQEPRSVGDIQEAILKEYEVDPDRCEADLAVLLRELASHGLIEVMDASAG